MLFVGDVLSSTVTVAEQVETLLLVSVTVNVTVLSPISLQSNVFGKTEIDCIAQLSWELLSISVALIVTLPVALNWTVISWQRAIGLVLSFVIISKEQFELFPQSSVAVIVIVVLPELS